MAKLVLLVLDSFGIGAMEDCRKYAQEDCSADTYKHIREGKYGLSIPKIYSLGLNRLADHTGVPEGAYARSALAHYGADTFMGHQELMGSKPKRPNTRLMKDVHDKVGSALTEKGFKVTYPWSNRPVLLVNDGAVVADNIESSFGNIINVTTDLSILPFSEAVEIGEAVRGVVDTSRVITLGGPHTSIEHILSVVREHHPGQWGVDSPNAKVYGEDYHVRHMGYGVNIDKQFQIIAEKSGLPIYRIGKTADVIHGEYYSAPIVNTSEVLKTLKETFDEEMKDAAFLVNIQETDLAGHAENPGWYASLLNETDKWLEGFIPSLTDDDMLIVTADHGNDPTIGHSRHTREYTPVLVTGPRVKSKGFGTRKTMADIGATMSAFFNLPLPEAGESFLKDLRS